MSTTVELRHEPPGVARVSFRSEKGIQILSSATCEQLRAIVKQLRRNDAVRVVVFEAEGRTFLAGADLNELRALDRRTARKYSQSGQRLFQRIAELPAVTICAIHAPCAGGGCEMALACDLRLAAAGARIGLPEVTLGLIPGWGGTVRATLLLGGMAARRIVLSGELLASDEACRLGLVDAVFADNEFRASVDARVAQLLKGGPAALAAAKRLIGQIENHAMTELLDLEARRFAACYAGDEPPEGLAAFLEKRAPRWAGDAATAKDQTAAG